MGHLTPFEKEWMAERHFKLVPHVIKSFPGKDNDHDELMGAGSMGLTKALDTFDVYKGTSFSTFAYKCIRNEILYYLRKEKKRLTKNVSMNTILSTDKNGHALELEDTISRAKQMDEKDAIQLMMHGERREKIMRAVALLNEKQQQVIIRRFGLNGEPIKTQNEVAKEICMSQANVSKIEDDALDRLKYLLHSLSNEI